MESLNQETQLTRKTAWWFIPEEYCPIFLELEKEFNKRIGKPISSSKLIEMVDNLLWAQINHYNDLVKKNEWTVYELDRTIHKAKGDSNPKLNIKKEQAINRLKRYNGYAEVLKDMDADEIVSHFEQYFENVEILVKDDNGFISFRKISDKIANYKVPFVTAQIILENITLDLESNSASRTLLFEAMHALIQDPLFSIKYNGVDNRSQALEDVYLERFKDGLQILKNNGLVAKVKGKTGHYEFVYKYTFEAPKELSQEEARKETNYRRREAALKELEQIHANFNQTTSTSKEKKKSRIKNAQALIAEKLSSIDQTSIVGRQAFHWGYTMYIYKYATNNNCFHTFAENLIIYLRYNNIKSALTNVKEGKLYEWDEDYYVWDDILKILNTEGIAYQLKNSIGEVDYRSSCHYMIQAIDQIINGADICENNYSLFYVKAHISCALGLSDTESILDKFYRFAASNTYYVNETKKEVQNNNDICMAINKLLNIVMKDAFEFSSRAKKWLYTLGNLEVCHAVSSVVAKIYLNLIIITPIDDKKIITYKKMCQKNIKQLATDTHCQRLEGLSLRYLYLSYCIKIIGTQELAELSQVLWKGTIEELMVEYDPRISKLYVDTFLLVYRYLNETGQVDYGISLPLAIFGIFSWLRGQRHAIPSIYFSLYEALEEFLYSPKGESIMETLESFGLPDTNAFRLRILRTQELYQSNVFSTLTKISHKLFDMGDIIGSIYCAEKAMILTNPKKLSDPREATDYIKIRLLLLRLYYMVGRWQDADAIIEDSSKRIELLSELYDESERNIHVDEVIELFNKLKLEFENPYYKQELRLDYILKWIKRLESISPELNAFYNRWQSFIDEYVIHRESCNNVLIKIFESDEFMSVLESITKEFKAPLTMYDMNPVTIDDLENFGKVLVLAYEKWAQHNGSNRSSTLVSKREAKYFFLRTPESFYGEMTTPY